MIHGFFGLTCNHEVMIERTLVPAFRRLIFQTATKLHAQSWSATKAVSSTFDASNERLAKVCESLIQGLNQTTKTQPKNMESTTKASRQQTAALDCLVQACTGFQVNKLCDMHIWRHARLPISVASGLTAGVKLTSENDLTSGGLKEGQPAESFW